MQYNGSGAKKSNHGVSLRIPSTTTNTGLKGANIFSHLFLKIATCRHKHKQLCKQRLHLLTLDYTISFQQRHCHCDQGVGEEKLSEINLYVKQAKSPGRIQSSLVLQETIFFVCFFMQTDYCINEKNVCDGAS